MKSAVYQRHQRRQDGPGASPQRQRASRALGVCYDDFMKIAIVGAESTGKTELSRQLAQHLHRPAQPVRLLPELLRHWCDSQGRTPRADEQHALLLAQADALEQAVTELPGSGHLIADTTPLLTAVFSDYLFGDRSLYRPAIAQQRRYDATLLTGLDLPWVADGIQRDGPQVRQPVDRLLRTALVQAGLPFCVIYGQGRQRLGNALRALRNAPA